MNELEEMKLLVDDFCKEADDFIARMKEYDRTMERNHREMMDIIRKTEENWERVNNRLNTLRHG